MQSLLYFKKGSETILDSLDPLFLGESASLLEFEPAHLPGSKFASRRSGCKSHPRRIRGQKGGRVYTKDKETSFLPNDQTIGSIRHDESRLSHVRNGK
jgi:hypothetical protein